jgi:flagellar hook assembly protein FlgD
VTFARPAPNPATSVVQFRFALVRGGPVRLSVLDVSGRRVRTFALSQASAGANALRWDRRDDAGRELAPGLYFARLEAGRETIAWPVVLAR